MLCLGAILLLNGAFWVVMQTVAWGCMVVDFAKNDSFTVAVAKTFDGHHPCQMCLTIRIGRSREAQTEQKFPLLKTEKMPELIWQVRWMTVPPPPTETANHFCFASESYLDYSETPPTPPPRA